MRAGPACLTAMFKQQWLNKREIFFGGQKTVLNPGKPSRQWSSYLQVVERDPGHADSLYELERNPNQDE